MVSEPPTAPPLNRHGLSRCCVGVGWDYFLDQLLWRFEESQLVDYQSTSPPSRKLSSLAGLMQQAVNPTSGL